MKHLCRQAVAAFMMLALVPAAVLAQAAPQNKPLADGTLFDGAKKPLPASYTAAASTVTYKSGDESGLNATFTADAKYPGITFPAPNGAWNLSDYSGIEVNLYNPGTDPITVTIRVDNDNGGDWTKQTWDFNHIVVVGGRTKTLKLKFGDSWGHPGGYALDPSHVTQVLLYCDSGVNATFVVESIKAAQVDAD